MQTSAHKLLDVAASDTGDSGEQDGAEEPKAPGLLAQIREDWNAHGRDYRQAGFHAVAVHRLGSWRSGIKTKLVRAPFSVIYRALNLLVRNFHGIELPSSAQLGRRVVIEQEGGIIVHGNAVIGDECIIRQDVKLGSRGTDRPYEAPRLGNRVSVGAGAKILGAVSVGDDARIGANSVICADVRPSASAMGIPVRVKHH